MSYIGVDGKGGVICGGDIDPITPQLLCQRMCQPTASLCLYIEVNGSISTLRSVYLGGYPL